MRSFKWQISNSENKFYFWTWTGSRPRRPHSWIQAWVTWLNFACKKGPLSTASSVAMYEAHLTLKSLWKQAAFCWSTQQCAIWLGKSRHRGYLLKWLDFACKNAPNTGKCDRILNVSHCSKDSPALTCSRSGCTDTGTCSWCRNCGSGKPSVAQDEPASLYEHKASRTARARHERCLLAMWQHDTFHGLMYLVTDL